ncbi:unnamed protein product [Symbiodinium microadriaticum]|nr:unnamed protein product [Symbiodinium microadriaticum]
MDRLFISGEEWLGYARPSLPNWRKIAYLLRYSLPLLFNNYKTEADMLLPYLALGALRREQYPDENLLLADHGIANHRPRIIIVDVGAHTGEFSQQVVEVFRSFGIRRHDGRANPGGVGQASVLAIEPSPTAYSQLIQNAREQGWGDSLCALNLAVASVPAERVALQYEGSMVASLWRPSRTGPEPEPEKLTTVQQETLDRLLSSGVCRYHTSEEIFILKLDCEGSDGDVLKGAENLLRNRSVKYVLFEETSRRDEPVVVDLQETLDSLWHRGYGCFLISDRFLVPVSGGWFHPLYRLSSQGGFVMNADFFCAQIHDPDLLAVIEGFVTRSNMPKAKEIVKNALEQWRQAQPELRQSVAEKYDLERLPRGQNLDKSLQAFYVADLLRSGYGAWPNHKERLAALKYFRRSIFAAQGAGKDRRLARPGAFELGNCYYFGECGGRSLNQAVRWYRRSLAYLPNDGYAMTMLMISIIESHLNHVNSSNSRDQPQIHQGLNRSRWLGQKSPRASRASGAAAAAGLSAVAAGWEGVPADDPMDGAIQRAIKAFAGRLDESECLLNGDVFDGFTNFMIFPKLGRKLRPSLDRFERRCGETLQRHAEDVLAAADSFQDLGKASQKIFYLHSFLGYPRDPMQGKLMEACRRIAASLEDGEDGDVEDVLSTVYKTSLFHNYGHGSYFSWSNENASNAIEEFEDLVIGFFDKSVTGLNLTECLGSLGWKLPNIYEDFMEILRTKIRPYPAPEEMDTKVLYHTMYFVTHLVYFFTGFGLETLKGVARLEMQPELRFLEAALPLLSTGAHAPQHKLEETDILGEVIYCHILLGADDSDPRIRQKRLAIVAKQRQDGLFGSSPDDDDDDDDDDGLDHATYNALTALIPHSWFPKPASTKKLSMMTPAALDELLRQAGILRPRRVNVASDDE